jgi:hypothetical protein
MNKATILMAALLVVVAATGLAIGGVVPSTVQTAQANPCSRITTLETVDKDVELKCEFD